MMGVKRKIAFFTVLLSVVLVVAHNVFPHHHGEKHHSECVGHQHYTHVCSEVGEKHLDDCGDHDDLCKTVYEFLNGNTAQVSHFVCVTDVFISIEPHVCTCKEFLEVDRAIDLVDQFWERNLPKRAPPVIA